MTRRTVPSDPEAEQDVLAPLLRGQHFERHPVGVVPGAFELDPQVFHVSAHKVIFEAICVLADGGLPATPQAVYERMQADKTAGSLAAHGGILCLALMAERHPPDWVLALDAAAAEIEGGTSPTLATGAAAGWWRRAVWLVRRAALRRQRLILIAEIEARERAGLPTKSQVAALCGLSTAA